MRKRILHIIDGLPRGGAETLLVGTINALVQFEHVIVSLTPKNDFEEELKDVEVVALDFKWYHSIPKVVTQVKDIIRDKNVDVVHAHLYWSTIVSRLAAPSSVKIINSYHNVLYGAHGASYPFYAKLLDKFTYNRNYITLCVSGEVRRDLEEHIGVKDNVHVLYNFIEDNFYLNFRPFQTIKKPLKIVAVGNLKPQKSYEVILEALSLLQGKEASYDCVVDIYGKGPLLTSLTSLAEKRGLKNIKFKGAAQGVYSILPEYDLYILSSTYEGFGIAVVEAMAVGLPVLVSNIEVLREVTGEQAIFFEPDDAHDLAEKIKDIIDGKYNLFLLSDGGSRQAQKYRKDNYMKLLSKIYMS